MGKNTQETPQCQGHKLQHYQQRYNWDCGVSCILMLLPPQSRNEFLENFSQICQEEGFGQSTWTIDLCYLLKRYNIRHSMYTTRIGVNEQHRRHGYYSKIMDLDTERVRRRFAQAKHIGIKVVEYPISDKEILDHVLNKGPAILLVDSGLMSCDLCKHNKLIADFRRVFGGAYRGHYIILIGRSPSGKWIYRDPGLSARICFTSPSRLRVARTAPGTDNDVILVYNDYRCYPEQTDNNVDLERLEN